MPRIAKYSEKMSCIRQGYYWNSPQGVRALRVPDRLLNQVMEISKITWSEATPHDKKTIFDLIEDIVTDTLSSRDTDSEFLKDFVEIKEVPYGRYNSDTNN